MDKLTVRKATAADTEAVLDFYHLVIDEMQGTDFDIFWKRDVHPSDEFLRQAIEQSYLYIGTIRNLSEPEFEEITCALVIDRSPAPGYEKVPWKIDAPASEVGIMHSVATRAKHHGKGFGTALLLGAIDGSREEGLRSLQLDTFIDNVRSHGLYNKLGFINHGAWPVYYDGFGTMELDFFEYVL